MERDEAMSLMMKLLKLMTKEGVRLICYGRISTSDETQRQNDADDEKAADCR